MPGFGFLKIGGMGKFLFFHFSELPDSTIKPKVGQVYDFVLGTNDKGPAAIDMVLVDTEVPPSAETALVIETTPVAYDAPTSVEESEPKKPRVRVRVGAGKLPHVAAIPPAAIVAPSGPIKLDSLAGLGCLLAGQPQPVM